MDAFEMIDRILDNPMIETVFDVGANEGQTLAQFTAFFPNACIFAFEPFGPCFSELEKNYGGNHKVRLFKLALAEEYGTKPFYLTQYSAVNSLLEIDSCINTWADTSDIDQKGSINVAVTTIDNIIRDHDISNIDLLKMDIQGGELLALKGAVGALNKQLVKLIYLEVLFAPLYEDQAYFWDIASFLSYYNYHFVNLFNVQTCDSGFIRWADAIFINDDLWNKWSLLHSASKLITS
jgi:FkbM family methyltransferase